MHLPRKRKSKSENRKRPKKLFSYLPRNSQNSAFKHRLKSIKDLKKFRLKTLDLSPHCRSLEITDLNKGIRTKKANKLPNHKFKKGGLSGILKGSACGESTILNNEVSQPNLNNKARKSGANFRKKLSKNSKQIKIGNNKRLKNRRTWANRRDEYAQNQEKENGYRPYQDPFYLKFKFERVPRIEGQTSFEKKQASAICLDPSGVIASTNFECFDFKSNQKVLFHMLDD